MFSSLKTVLASFCFACHLPVAASTLDSVLQTADVAVLGTVIRQELTWNSDGTVDGKFDFIVQMSSRGGKSSSKFPELMPGDTLHSLEYRSPNTIDTLYIPTRGVFVLTRVATESGWMIHPNRRNTRDFWWSHEFEKLDTAWYRDSIGELCYRVYKTSGEWIQNLYYTSSDTLTADTKRRKRGSRFIVVSKSYQLGVLMEHKRTKYNYVFCRARAIEWTFRQNGKPCIDRHKRWLPNVHF